MDEGRSPRRLPPPAVRISGESSQSPATPANFVAPLVANIPSPLSLERRSASAMASLSSAHCRWFAYRDERTSSSSSDSGVVVCLSPPAPSPCLLGSSMTSLIALSPPGLSPLNVNDSPFSTPTPSSSRSRFTFDHVPFHGVSPAASTSAASVESVPASCETRIEEQESISSESVTERSAFGLADRRRSESLDKVLQSVRRGAPREHPKLERKQSVIQNAATTTIVAGAKLKPTYSAPGTSFFAQTDLPKPVETQLTVSVADNYDSLLQSQMLFNQLYPPNSTIRPQHQLLSASYSSPISSSSFHNTTASTSASVLLSPASIEADPSPRSATSTEPPTEEDPNKQFLCHICKKDFKRPDILSRHVRRHTGEKPFGCESCGRFFSRSDHLRTHRRTHTDEKPYHCSICSYSARRRDVLTRHMSTRHQAKAGLSVYQRHRDVRRCLSDGDTLNNRKEKSRTRLATTGGTKNNDRIDSTATDGTSNEDDVGDLPKMEDIEDDVIVDFPEEELDPVTFEEKEDDDEEDS
ncbi:unnamed protein product [Caenorhabditis auriculariae]|uniref:C2H2-type domain-containing protein n=1 Tax=Caenorhabditis auriculariae TaxID=2777116 RepID=A0A8S1HPU0_9PELO|nr:unnamed protein product [Caenorhabditis auriculariae]